MAKKQESGCERREVAEDPADAKLWERGRVPRHLLRNSMTRGKGEVFSVELLTDPVLLERSDDKTCVTIDRRNVTEVVVSNTGKAALCREYVTGRRTELLEEDREIQRFLMGASSECTRTVAPRELNLPLRWASGGVLSIVTFRGRRWIPLFFRDIPPYGWNISLGSSERCFDENNNLVAGYNLDHELNNPWPHIVREFLEESLVIDADPALTSPVFVRHFSSVETIPHPDPWPQAKGIAEKHAALRREEDKLTIRAGTEAQTVRVRFLKTGMTLKVTPCIEETSPTSIDDVLVCFSLFDLGIEVVKVAAYDLDDDDYMLDGEMLFNNGHSPGNGEELVRMPIALVSCEYLAETFGPGGDWFHYSRGMPPSIEVRRPPPADDVHLFEWDVKQRMDIVKGRKMGSDRQKLRFNDWFDKFGKHFVDRRGNPHCGDPCGLFVPGTAKILNLGFSMPIDWRS